MVRQLRIARALGDLWLNEGHAVFYEDQWIEAKRLSYSSAAYQGGALTLYALQQVVGAKTFIALAARIAHRDLEPFLNSRLYSTHLPAMPNHPDWKPGPA